MDPACDSPLQGGPTNFRAERLGSNPHGERNTPPVGAGFFIIPSVN